MVTSIIDDLSNTVVQRGELRNVGCVRSLVKLNVIIIHVTKYHLCVQPSVWGISAREATASVEIRKGLVDARHQCKASRDRDCSYKKGAARRRKKKLQTESERERREQTGRCTEERSETTWQQGIARRTVQPSPGVCTCRWTVQESLTSNEDTDDPDAVSTRRWTERKRSCEL